VHPVHAEAHALPFAEGFFDALVSIGAYHYFGTDDLYLGYYSRFVKPGGQLGIIQPGLAQEYETLPHHTSSPTGNGTSAPGTAQPGGAGTGRRPAWSPSRWPIAYPTGGETGCSGTKPATTTAVRRGAKKRRCSTQTPAEPSVSPESSPIATPRLKRTPS
jgi:hypothetical protein